MWPGLRYRKARKAEKAVILNEFCESTGYNRKHAIGLLKNVGRIQTRRPGGSQVQKITAKTRKKYRYELITARTRNRPSRSSGRFPLRLRQTPVACAPGEHRRAAGSARSGRGRSSNSGFPSALSGAGTTRSPVLPWRTRFLTAVASPGAGTTSPWVLPMPLCAGPCSALCEIRPGTKRHRRPSGTSPPATIWSSPPSAARSSAR